MPRVDLHEVDAEPLFGKAPVPSAGPLRRDPQWDRMVIGLWTLP